ncbi:MAG: aminomethyl-transferring glycine dehydrogenase subunit GcvPA [Anaerolineae bacterium]
MGYVPHTERDRREMLATVGVGSIEELFLDVPEAVRFPAVDLPAPLSEPEVLAEMAGMAGKNWDAGHHPCFLGAGAYHHFIPSVVKHVVSRGEFYTAYTPYQPEVSQGTLQAAFEYQTMICDLTGMDVANASHYDGATSLAEALILALNVHRGQRHRVVMSRGVNPQHRQTARTYVQGIDLAIVGDDVPGLGPSQLADLVDEQTACVVVQVPDFLGGVPDIAALRRLGEKAHSVGALLVVSANPISLGVLRPPSEYGADVVVGEGQPLGNPLSFGGPYLGFFATLTAHVRRMAGRLVGMTVDVDGKRGFVLTLATREQHIRRERATSNICSNQALNALTAAAYLAAMGPSGLRTVATHCYSKAHYAAARIAALPGYTVPSQAFFHEFVVRCPRPVAEVSRALLDGGIIPGYDLEPDYPELAGCMLFCCTEMNTRRQIDGLVAALEAVA